MQTKIKYWITAIAGLCCTSGVLYAQVEPVWSDGIIPTLSVWSGVYSAAQARRGENAYQDDQCGDCHGQALEGDPDNGVPELAGSHFMVDWDGYSVLELVRHMHSMPIGNPGDVGIMEATDLSAFILRENKIPSGNGDLSLDRHVLAGMRMDAQKP